MGTRKHNCFPPLKWLMCKRNLLSISVILALIDEAQNASVNCPTSTGTLFAYPEGDVYDFQYTFDPLFKTNIDLLDRFLTSDDDVICDWEVKAKGDHFASISFTQFGLVETSGSKDGDCLAIYDGSSEADGLLAHLCGGDEPEENYVGSGRYLFIVFTQGKRTGRRYFSFTYKAIPFPKDLIIKTAAIASSTVAAVAIIFLAFKFTHCCLPCRKRCCPDHSDPEASPPRELRPLTPVPPSAADGREDNWRNEERDRNNAVARQTSRPPNLTLGHYEVEDDGQISPPPDEPPPSYDSIFADTEQGNKAS